MALVPPPPLGLDMQVVLERMLQDLSGFLPGPVNGQPLPTVILLSLNDVPVGVGNFIGEVPRLPMGRMVIKGGRLDCVVRFLLFGGSLPQVNDAVLILQANLLAAAQSLASLGFLRFTSLTSSNPAFDSTLSAWGRGADYSLLYEYRYQPTDDAQSLIARSPIAADANWHARRSRGHGCCGPDAVRR